MENTTSKKTPEDTPGPGAYIVFSSKNLQKHIQWEEESSSLRERDETPGPGNYSGSPEKLKTSIPSFSMSGRHDLKQNYSDSPGPGAYTLSPPKSPAKAVTGVEDTTMMLPMILQDLELMQMS